MFKINANRNYRYTVLTAENLAYQKIFGKEKKKKCPDPYTTTIQTVRVQQGTQDP